MRRKILITGGQGFVGRALVERFSELGYAVVSADIGDPPPPSALRAFATLTPASGGGEKYAVHSAADAGEKTGTLSTTVTAEKNGIPSPAGGGGSGRGQSPGSITHLKLDIRDREAVTRACAGMDSIIHNASLVHTKHNREEDVWAVNLGGTENIMAACKAHSIPRLVYISSASAVYEGRDIENGDETLPYSNISQAPYADSKIAAEKAVLAFSGSGATRACAIRPHVIFGAGDRRFIPAILDKARQGKMTRAVGNRDKLSDFTYISNLVDAVVAAEERLQPGSPVCGQAYFITNGEPMAFFDFIEKFIVEMGYPPIRGKVPYWLAYGVAAIAEAVDTLRGGTLNAENGLTRFSVRYMVTHHYFNIAKAKRDLGWEPRVSLAEGIKLTAQQLS